MDRICRGFVYLVKWWVFEALCEGSRLRRFLSDSTKNKNDRFTFSPKTKNGVGNWMASRTQFTEDLWMRAARDS